MAAPSTAARTIPVSRETAVPEAINKVERATDDACPG
jgi:hypothetical protein